jgi:thiol-disulfide isomerase/thioredoxin
VRRSNGEGIRAILASAAIAAAVACSPPSAADDATETVPSDAAADQAPGTRRHRMPTPDPKATPDELLAYIESITDPALEPESRGRLRYHRRKVASLTAAAAELFLARVPEDDPRHARAVDLKREAEAAAMPPAAQADAGAERLRSLTGKPLDLTGTLLDGSAFDQATLAGKVVLVDFWATWCGPCVAEIPRVRDAYDRYHERGFEVLGISLDEDHAALAAFVAEREIPWPIMVDARDDAGGLARRYGISAIPTMILVGRDGAVVSTEARGRQLEELLDELFPAP